MCIHKKVNITFQAALIFYVAQRFFEQSYMLTDRLEIIALSYGDMTLILTPNCPKPLSVIYYGLKAHVKMQEIGLSLTQNLSRALVKV